MNTKAIILFLILLSPVSLYAHPHVWIDASVKIHLNDKKQVTAITEVWEFDDMFSLAVIEANDKNKDKKFDKEETLSVKNSYFLNLKNYGFYTNVFVDGKEFPLSMTLSSFSAEIVDEKVIYVFTIKLSKPLDPFKHKVDLGIYDSEYYADIFYAQDPFYAQGIKEGECPYYIFEDKKHPTYFGLVNPKTIRLCRKP
ncbi:MAG: DUF1007 family protein [Elusimicrobiales bacterium]|nr:DUF1007 family protein [Elusimicrobiales bacterium]MCK5583640.1 DUF1007 family protein [Elusimicrobiales bacterium]